MLKKLYIKEKASVPGLRRVPERLQGARANRASRGAGGGGGGLRGGRGRGLGAAREGDRAEGRGSADGPLGPEHWLRSPAL